MSKLEPTVLLSHHLVLSSSHPSDFLPLAISSDNDRNTNLVFAAKQCGRFGQFSAAKAMPLTFCFGQLQLGRVNSCTATGHKRVLRVVLLIISIQQLVRKTKTFWRFSINQSEEHLYSRDETLFSTLASFSSQSSTIQGHLHTIIQSGRTKTHPESSTPRLAYHSQ